MSTFLVIEFAALRFSLDAPYLLCKKVPRASASAVAFGMGLFSDKGSLGPGRHRAFAITSESRASDIVLRFYDCCETYKVTSMTGTF